MKICDITKDLYRVCARYQKYSLILTVSVLFFSCEEQITVNLRNESSKVVIEGYITDGMNPVVVKISKSQPFFDQSNFIPVKNATVQMESLSKKEKLTEKVGGRYVTSRTQGVAGRTYSLKVSTATEAFTATVVLPVAVPVDTIYFKPGIFRTDSLNVFVGFTDPATTENYYRIKLFRNRRLAVNDYYLLTDAFSNGAKMVVPIYYRFFAPGDTVVVELFNLERSTWRYFKGLSESIQQGVNSQAPGNPPSNFTGGALGIFGAWGTSNYQMVVPRSAEKK